MINIKIIYVEILSVVCLYDGLVPRIPIGRKI